MTDTLTVHAEEIDYVALARLRRGLGQIDSSLQSVSSRHGCTASMYQLLLAVRTGRRGDGLDIGMLAGSLGIRHPSAAEMVRKAEAAGFVRLEKDESDGRRVLVELSAAGRAALDAVARSHRAELLKVRAAFIDALYALDAAV